MTQGVRAKNVGVTFKASRNKWQARYYDRASGIQYYLGLYESEEIACAIVREFKKVQENINVKLQKQLRR